ncbi:BamA/TamA family outer membrane protein [Roseivirga sp.]|uniref:BamA/TamA family outer membrane protein n=1 Tax=Roseivirga sp. TaxID=1964215 RepID=UPI003B8E0B1E
MFGNRGWWCFCVIWLFAAPSFICAQGIPELDPESTVKVGKIYITGNNKTRNEIVLREIDFEEGQELKLKDFAEKVLLDQQKLVNTRLFVFAEIVPLFMSDTEVDVLIRLQERWYIFPLPVFKLADRNFTEWWVNQNRDFARVNYGAQLIHTNLTGRNDKLRVRAQFGFAKQYSLSYSIPYINNAQTIGLGFSTSFTTNKTVGVQSSAHRLEFIESDDVIRRSFGISGTVTLRPSFYTRHSVSLGYGRSSVSDLILDTNPNYHTQGQNIQKYLRLSYVFGVDKRDYIAYPLNGSSFNFQATKFGLGLVNNLDMLTARISYAKYFDLKNGFYLANKTEAFKNFSNEVPYLIRSGFGYRPDFIRGYERFVVETKALISHRSALRFKVLEGVQELSRRSLINQFRTLPYAFYLKLFIDTGYAGNPLDSSQNNFLNNQFLGSLGLGIDVVTYYDFVIRLEYSVNKQGDGGLFFNFKAAI